jgi:hypothetical protein
LPGPVKLLSAFRVGRTLSVMVGLLLLVGGHEVGALFLLLSQRLTHFVHLGDGMLVVIRMHTPSTCGRRRGGRLLARRGGRSERDLIVYLLVAAGRVKDPRGRFVLRSMLGWRMRLRRESHITVGMAVGVVGESGFVLLHAMGHGCAHLNAGIESLAEVKSASVFIMQVVRQLRARGNKHAISIVAG